MSFEMNVQRRLGSHGIDFHLSSAAGIIALFGPSGVGKSSILNMAAGLLRPDSGRIEIEGRRLFDSESGIDIAAAQRRCGYIFQDARLFPHLSVQANLLYGFRARGGRTGHPPAWDATVALLDIGHLLHRRPSSLSGGEAQRIAIGRALLSDPAFLLMDEPCSSLDHARRQDIIAMILALHREARIPILYVSHDREEVNALADEIIELPPPSRPGCGA